MLTPIEVNSSSIEALGYDENKETLYINFRKGGLYRYFGVNFEVWENFRKSSTKGKYFHNMIRDKYKKERVA